MPVPPLPRLVLQMAALMVLIAVTDFGFTVLAARKDLPEWQDRTLVRAQSFVSHVLLTLPESQRGLSQVETLVRLFDTDPAVRLQLRDPWGQQRLRSVEDRPESDVPQWFALLTGVNTEARTISLGPLGSLNLSVVPDTALARLWSEARHRLLVLGFGGLALLAVALLALRRSLQPIPRFAAAAQRLGAGDIGVRLADDGSAISRSFNTLVDRLAEVTQQNSRLARQIDRLLDEERTELARNLHDDIGPQLFAVDVDAGGIELLARREPIDGAAIAQRAATIRAATTDMKRHVRGLLDHLRPTTTLKLGLVPALQDIADYWRERLPDLAFVITVAPAAETTYVDGVVHAVVREAVANAVKHGKPSEIRIDIDLDGSDLRLRVADNGGGADGFVGKGYGIIGMRERVSAVGGRLLVDRRVDVPGVVVAATLLLDAATSENQGPQT